MDGEWEPPMVDNPEFKGEWQPRQLENPNYKGAWVHPEIDNPEYQPDENVYLRKEICTIGYDLFQVKSGTIFDNVLITDDIEYASKLAAKVTETQAGEKKMKEAQDAEENHEEDEELKKNSAEPTKDDDEDEDDDDDNEIETEKETGIPEVEEDTSNEHDEL